METVHLHSVESESVGLRVKNLWALFCFRMRCKSFKQKKKKKESVVFSVF